MPDTLVTQECYRDTDIPVTSHITRYDYSMSFRAWAVRMRRNGDSLRRYFPDEKYGGVKDAFEAARQQRERWLNLYGDTDPVAAMNSKEAQDKSFWKRNKTGVLGMSVVLKGDRDLPYVVINRASKSGRTQRSISLLKYGIEHAGWIASRFMALKNCDLTVEEVAKQSHELLDRENAAAVFVHADSERKDTKLYDQNFTLVFATPTIGRCLRELGVPLHVFAGRTEEERRAAYDKHLVDKTIAKGRSHGN